MHQPEFNGVGRGRKLKNNGYAGLRVASPWWQALAAAALAWGLAGGGLAWADQAPETVYVDAAYPPGSGAVTFPYSGAPGPYSLGFDAFPSLQAAIDHVAPGGTVQVAPGTYVENLSIRRPVSLLGPNAGKPGSATDRGAEASIIPAINDPESTPIISIETANVLLDGLLLDGHNGALTGGYHANGVEVHAAAAIQNGVYSDEFMPDFDHLTVQNCIIRNLSYDGIYLDRFSFFESASGYNYIRRNQFENAWEGLLTYAVHAAITDNTFVNVNHGLSIHGIVTPAPAGFTPVVSGNTLTIAQWWPAEIEVTHAPGIWINYRRLNAAPLQVVSNIINTPVAPPAGKTIVGLYALDVAQDGSIDFVDNVVNGAGHCAYGLFAAQCWSNNAIRLRGGSLSNITSAGVLADTLDFSWDAGDSLVTVSNVSITMAGGDGVLAWPEASTNRAQVTVIGNTTIAGAAAAVHVRGANATAVVKNNTAPLAGNQVGVDVAAGKALLENNNLTGNAVAAILAEDGGVVDAGDCTAGNITGLGSSTGLNVLRGYSFDHRNPWAIENLGTGTVLAYQNDFGADAGHALAAAVFGPVSFSQSGAATATAPPNLVVPSGAATPGAVTCEDFLAQGGAVSFSPTAVEFQDTAHPVGGGSFTRTYTLTGQCGLSATCTQTITVAVLPEFTVQPVNTTNLAGTTATFTVAAYSNGPLTYQWKKSGVALTGATSATLTLDNVQEDEAGAYIVEVSNAAGTVTSDPALLVVVKPLGTAFNYSEGAATISVPWLPGLTHAVVKVSTDLVNWEPLEAGTPPFISIDTDAALFNQRFYRVLYYP